jgi:hypothetical protein
MDAVVPNLPMTNEQMNALDAVKAQAKSWLSFHEDAPPQLVLGYWAIRLSGLPGVPGKSFRRKLSCHPAGSPLTSADWQAAPKIACYLGANSEPKHWTSGNNAFLEWEW